MSDNSADERKKEFQTKKAELKNDAVTARKASKRTFSGNLWKKAYSEDGTPYYYNTKTRKTTWSKPSQYFDEEGVEDKKKQAPNENEANKKETVLPPPKPQNTESAPADQVKLTEEKKTTNQSSLKLTSSSLKNIPDDTNKNEEPQLLTNKNRRISVISQTSVASVKNDKDPEKTKEALLEIQEFGNYEPVRNEEGKVLIKKEKQIGSAKPEFFLLPHNFHSCSLLCVLNRFTSSTQSPKRVLGKFRTDGKRSFPKMEHHIGITLKREKAHGMYLNHGRST